MARRSRPPRAAKSRSSRNSEGPAPLLDGARIAPNRGKIGGHRSRFPRSGGIMFPQESRTGLLELPRTAVTCVAGVGENLRGRLAGLEMISYTSGPKLGDAEAGIVATLLSIRTSVVSGGILCVVGTAIISALIPQFVRYQGSEGIRQKELAEAMRETETRRLILE